MEKNLKKIRTLAILIVAVLLAIVAFCGVYFKTSGIWLNKLPDFNYGMELSGMRELRFKLDDSEEEKEVYIDSAGNIAGEVINDSEDENSSEISLVQDETTSDGETNAEEKDDNIPEGYSIEKRTIKVNEDSAINEENFEKAKRIIQKRLENSTYEYNIRLDNQTGELIIEVPDNDEVEEVETLVTTVGKIEIIDAQNGLVLLDDSGIKNAVSTYNTTTENGYQGYLVLNYDKKSAEKLKEISNKYVEVKNEEENAENTEQNVENTETETAETEETNESSEPQTTINYIQLKLDNQALLKTYFGQELANGMIQIPVGSATTDVNEFSKTYKQVAQIAQIVKSEKLPLTYKLSSDNYIQSNIDKNNLILKIGFAVIIFVVSLYFVIRFKLNGLKSAIVSIGYVGLIIIILKYTNVIITLNSLIAFLSVIAINYIFNNILLQKISNGADVKVSYLHSIKELYMTIIPVCIIAIIFTFMHSTIISSIGMVLFWGVFIQAIYDSLLILVLNEK